MRGWFREASKFCFNATLLTIAVFLYGSVTNPTWRFLYALLGLVLVALFLGASVPLWRKGKDDE